MRLNLRLVLASQFPLQFKLNVGHKSGKEHIIPDLLSRLVSANTRYLDRQHSELDALFTYNTMLVEMHPALVSQILVGYKPDPWWAQLQQQIQANNDLRADTMILLLVFGSTSPTDSDPYLALRLYGGEDLSPNSMDIREILEGFPTLDKSKLLYHINRLTNVHRLFILPSIAPDILAVAHGESHLGFSRCYEIITCSWFIHGFTKLLATFIRYCPQ